MARTVIYLRLVPAAVWVMTQLAMAGAMAPAKAQPAELRALAKMLQVDSVTLCNSERNGGEDPQRSCPWCQGFAAAIMPTAPDAVTALDCAGPAHMRLGACLLGPGPAGLAYVSRAPPA